MATVNVVKGSVDEAILKKQFGNQVNYNYTDQNQFTGQDRVATNNMYREELAKAGIKPADAGDLWGYTGITTGNQPSGPKVTDNTEYIKSQSQMGLDATLAAIKQAVQQAIQKQKGIISQAPEQYGNLKNTAYNQSLASLPGMRENTANMGASREGGYSRTTETRANSDMMNKLGELDRQKQAVIDQANQAIAELEAQGNLDAANATRESAMAQLQAITAETSRLDNLYNQNYWNAENLAYTKSGREQEQANWLKEFNAAQEQNAWERAFAEAGRAAQTVSSGSSGYGSSGGGGSSSGGSSSGGSSGSYKTSDANTATMAKQIDSALASGASADELYAELNDLESSGVAALKKYDMSFLRNYIAGKKPKAAATPTTSWPAGPLMSTSDFYKKYR